MTRDELRNTHVLTPILQVNLQPVSFLVQIEKEKFHNYTYISPYISACSFPHSPCWLGGNWKVFPTIGLPGMRGGSLYFLFAT